MEDRVMLNNSQGKKQEVEDHRRNVKFSKNKTSITACNDSLNAKTSNVNFVCATCEKCVLNEKHDMCVLKSLNGVNSRTKMPMVVLISTRKPKRIVNQSVAKPLRRTLVEIILFIVDSGCSKHMTGNLKLLTNFVENFLGSVKFGNDQIAPILGYGDLVQGAVTIKRVYYVEGMNHNLFSVGQFCDADLEVAFQKSTCYIRDLNGNDLLTGSRGTYLYFITLQDTSSPNPICLMAKATSSQAWLWHRRLSHLNFDTINLLSKNDIVIGLPKLKFVKDYLCSSYELGKAKRKSFQTKTIPASKRRLQLLHMDLCGPMRVESINGKKYAGIKDRPPMLAPGNYVQWKSRIKRYIDTKPNHELIHYCLMNPPYKFNWANMKVLIFEGSPVTRTESQMETYKTVLQDIRDQLNAKAEAVQIILTGIDNDIYSTVDACPNACEMWKAIERLKQGESINVNVQFLLQLQPEWQRFMTLVKQSQELKTISYHKLYDIMKHHQNEVNEIKAERIARVANPLARVAQQKPVYHPQNHPTHYTQNSSTRSQQAITRNRRKAIVNSPQPIYDQEPSMVVEDDETSKDKEIDKLMDLISLSFKKIYKPTNNNLRTSSNTSRANPDNSLRINISAGYKNQRIGNVVGARETVGSTVKPKWVKDTAYHKEKMLLCKQEEAGIQLNVKQADWRDDTDDDELEDQELEAHYMYMAQLQEVSPDAADSGPIFDDEPLQKVSNDDHYNVFAIESAHPEQSKSILDTYHIEQAAHNVIIDSLDMSYDREEIDRNDDDNDLANERELLASLIKKLQCEIDEIVTNFWKHQTSDYKKSEAELARRNSMEYASQMEIKCA
nr:retrovirus-related Pol polyprotein from transposon TNT 1-94 [Tanacetum cinerariifolium]